MYFYRMNSNVVTQQINQIKSNLIAFISVKCNTLPDKIYLSKSIFHLSQSNTNTILFIWGLDKNGVLFDSPEVNHPKTLNLMNLPVEVLIKLVEELEFDEKKKQIEKD